MVWFQCEDCGDSIKKPKLDAHFMRCSARRLSCIDCLAVFDRHTVKFHTSCVTEHEKYAEGATKPGGYAAGGYTSGGSAGTSGGANAQEPVGLEHTSTRPPWKCFLCNVNCTSKENLLAHAASKKHRNKYKRVSGGGDTNSNTNNNTNNNNAKVDEGKDKETNEMKCEVVPVEEVKMKEIEKKSSSTSKDDKKLKKQLQEWNKHTKKIMKKRGGKVSLEKLCQLVRKRIVKKSKVEADAAWKEKIESTFKKKVKKSSHFLLQGEDVLLKKIF